MLYVVMLTYVGPADEVQAHLDSHRDWLIEHARAGRILVAGPLEPRTGGLVLAHCSSRTELDGMLAEDSFYVHRLVDYDIRCFNPALRAAAFPEQWAGAAKPT